MKYMNVKVRLIACFAVLCFLVAAGSPAAQAQTPTSGALLKIDGTVGATTVHLTIYDSQIHSGHVQTPPCDPNFPTDAYVLQGGSWTGCDNNDPYEVTDGSQSGGGPHQYPGNADLTGTGYSFHIKTDYLFNEAGVNCNTSGTICANPDSGFLTVTNNSGAAFSGTITLQGTPQTPTDPTFCRVDAHGNAVDTSSAGLGIGAAVTLGLGYPGAVGTKNADSSNCGGFNAPQTVTLGTGANIIKIGGDDFEITPFLGGIGDDLTVLPIPVPAGPLVGGNFGADLGLDALGGSRFSATNFPGQASIPIADLSAAGNPVGLEFQVTCTNGPLNDCANFIYTAQTDFTIDTNSYPGGIGGPHFLGQHEGTPDSSYHGNCPTNGFSVDIFLSYTGGIGDPPLLGSSDGWSCFVGTFDPTAVGVPAGSVVKQQTLIGFQSPVSDTKLNVIKAGSAVALKWQTLDGSGNPVTNLNLCTHFGGAGCTTPWVFVGTTVISCANDAVTTNTESVAAEGASGFQNLGNGVYQFNWQTSKGQTGCVTPVLQFSNGFVSFSVANFQFK